MCMCVWYVCVYGVPMCVDTRGMCVETQSGRQKSFPALLHLTHGVGVPQLNLELTDGLGWLAGSFQGSSVFIFLCWNSRLPFMWVQKIWANSSCLWQVLQPLSTVLYFPLLLTSTLRSHLLLWSSPLTALTLLSALFPCVSFCIYLVGTLLHIYGSLFSAELFWSS